MPVIRILHILSDLIVTISLSLVILFTLPLEMKKLKFNNNDQSFTTYRQKCSERLGWNKAKNSCEQHFMLSSLMRITGLWTAEEIFEHPQIPVWKVYFSQGAFHSEAFWVIVWEISTYVYQRNLAEIYDRFLKVN